MPSRKSTFKKTNSQNKNNTYFAISKYFEEILPVISSDIKEHNTKNKTIDHEEITGLATVLFNQFFFYVLTIEKKILQKILEYCESKEQYFSFDLFFFVTEKILLKPKSKQKSNPKESKEEKQEPVLWLQNFFLLSEKYSKIKLKHILAKKIFQELFSLLKDDSFTENKINSRIFGELFEHSLLFSELETQTKSKENSIVKSSQKFSKGIFYTQKKTIKILLRHSLVEFLTEKKDALKITKLFSYPKNDCLNDSSFDKIQKKILSEVSPKEQNKLKEDFGDSLQQYRIFLQGLKILDPSCGTGFFLIEIFSCLYREYELLRQWEKFFDLKKNNYMSDAVSIFKNNLYGTDSNCHAIETSKFSLYCSFLIEAKNKVLLKETINTNKDNFLPNIVCANFLLNDSTTEKNTNQKLLFSEVAPKGFDVVVGNPPYVSYYSRHSRYSQKNFTETKNLQQLIKQYQFCNIKKSSKRYNLSMFFLEKGISLCKPNGKFAFIVDMNILEKSFWAIRKWITENAKIYKIVLGLKEFANVHSGQVLLFSSGKVVNSFTKEKLKEQEEKNYSIKFFDKDFNLLGKKTLQQLRQEEYSFEYVATDSIITKLKKQPSLEKFCEIFSGVNIGGASHKFLFQKKSFDKSSAKLANNYLPFLTTQEFSRSYQHIENLSQYIHFEQELSQQVNEENIRQKNRSVIVLGKRERFEKNKIFIRQSATKITATLVTKTSACSYSIFVLKNKSLLSDFVLLSLLNSKLISYYAHKTFLIRSGNGKQPQIRKSGLLELPIINLTEDFHKENYVKLEKNTKEILMLEKQMYELEHSLSHNNTLDSSKRESKKLAKDIARTSIKRRNVLLQQEAQRKMKQKEEKQVQIDELVFNIFSLTEEEKQTVRDFSF